MNDRDWERLVDYFTGALNSEEARELEEWIAAEPGRAWEVASLRRIWETSGRLPRRYDSGAAWARIAEQVEPAATVISPRLAAAHSRRREPPRAIRLARAAAIILALGGSSALGLHSPLGDRLLDRPVPIEEWIADSTTRGQRLLVTLGDGSEVLLGPESRLLHPPRFRRRSRDVRLEGTGYFTVQPDAERTFVVRAGRGVASVLGTRFVVRAYPDEPEVHVAVEEGRVSIRSQNDPEDAIAPILEVGDIGVVPEHGSARSLGSTAAERFLAWTEGRLVFDRTPVPELFRELERWYGVEMRSTDPSLAERRLTLSVDDEPLASVLAVLAATLDATYAHEAGMVTFRPLHP